MVQILPLIGAAALLAQTAFGAAGELFSKPPPLGTSALLSPSVTSMSLTPPDHAVPVKRTQYSNNYNSESNQYMSANQDTNQDGYGNAYQQNQDSNQYGNAYQQSQDSNQYGNGYQMTTTVAEQAMETTMMMEHNTMMDHNTMMEHETTTMEQMAQETSSVMAMETSSAAYSMPTYGSGSSQWNSGYNNCVSRTSHF
jgi:hypothetical protein